MGEQSLRQRSAGFRDIRDVILVFRQFARAMRLAQAKRVKLQDLIAAARQDLNAATTVLGSYR